MASTQPTKPPVPATRSKWWLSLVLLVIVLLGMVYVVTSPVPMVVEVRLIGYATNASGVSVVRFEAQNKNPFPIQRGWFPEVEIDTPTGWQMLSNSVPHPRILSYIPATPPGLIEQLEIPIPQTASPWRLQLKYYEPESALAQELRHLRRAIMWKFGVNATDSYRLYHTYSDPVKP